MKYVGSSETMLLPWRGLCVQESVESQTPSHAMLAQATLLTAVKNEVRHRREIDD